MQLERYPYKKVEEKHWYQFYSIGPKGKFKERICFQLKTLKPVPFFNLFFGVWNKETKEIDDSIVTNNADTIKVLSTVAACVLVFTNDRPAAWIYARGRTRARTRLYQMRISLVLDELKDKVEIMGELNGRWSRFRKGINYDALLLRSNN